MNEEFQKYLMSILESTGDFLSSEIPIIAEQILSFYLAVNVFYASVYLLIVAGGLLTVKPLIKYTGDFNCSMDRATVRSFYFVIGGFIFGAFLFSALSDIAIILKIWLAPKLFLLEYASSLVK